MAHAFTYFNIEHVPRGKNARADALAWLAASMTPHRLTVNPTKQYHTVFERRILPPLDTYEALAECNRRSVRITVDEVGIRRLEISFHRLYPIRETTRCLERKGKYPKTCSEVPLRSSNENIVSEILRWSAPAVSVGPRCREGQETHNGIFGAHQRT